MKDRIAAILEYLERHDRYVVTGHVKPDGDSCGAVVALTLFLRAMGKEASIYAPESFPGEYRFLLEGVEPGKCFRDGRILLALDCGDIERIACDGDIDEKMVVNIDHHAGNNGFGAISLVNPDASSVCEIVYDMIRQSGATPEKRIYEALYVGIMTDTGNFTFSNAGASTFAAVSEIVSVIGDPSPLNIAVYSSKPLAKIRLTGLVMNRAEAYCGGKLLISTVTLADMAAYGIGENDFDGIIDRLRDVAGVEVYILLKEKEGGKVRLSLRSKGRVPVNGFAALLESGGGHSFAAGATSSGTLEEVRAETVKYWERIL